MAPHEIGYTVAAQGIIARIIRAHADDYSTGTMLLVSSLATQD